MNSAKKLDGAENEESHLSETTDSGSERRHNPDSKARDRRVIQRFNEPTMRVFARWIYRISNIWLAFSVLYVAGLVGAHITRSSTEGTRSTFFAIVVIIIAVAVYNFGRACRAYVENESQARLVKVMERCFHLMLATIVMSIILGIGHLITMF
jgi:uncharacterized membrane protein YidH (DUF202 family)